MATSTLIPLNIAAEKSHTTTLNLLMHIKRGLLPAEERDGRWFISEVDLNAFIAENRKAEPGGICVHNSCGKGCGSRSEG